MYIIFYTYVLHKNIISFNPHNPMIILSILQMKKWRYADI